MWGGFLGRGFISLLANGPHHYHPVCTKDLPISPRFTPCDFLSRWNFSILTTRLPIDEIYFLTFSRFPLRKKEYKSCYTVFMTRSNLYWLSVHFCSMIIFQWSSIFVVVSFVVVSLNLRRFSPSSFLAQQQAGTHVPDWLPREYKSLFCFFGRERGGRRIALYIADMIIRLSWVRPLNESSLRSTVVYRRGRNRQLL